MRSHGRVVVQISVEYFRIQGTVCESAQDKEGLFLAGS